MTPQSENLGASHGTEVLKNDASAKNVGSKINPSQSLGQRRGETELRLYQSDAIARADAEIAAGHRRLLLVLPTGAGKTVVAAAIIRRAVGVGERVLFLAHRIELIRQASRKLLAAGVDHGIIQAGMPTRPGERVQVASVQTLYARCIRSHAVEVPQADLVIVDEAHHAKARTYERLVAHYPDAIIIGLTATPCRADGRGLGDV